MSKELSNSAKRMIALAEKISDPELRKKKIKDVRKLAFSFSLPTT